MGATSRYDYGPAENAAWFREREEVCRALEGLHLTGHVLELACGTGNWTLPLSRTADRLTALDGSDEMLRINRARVRSERVTYLRADLFTWQPPEEYDAVVFLLARTSLLTECALSPNGAAFAEPDAGSFSSTSRGPGHDDATAPPTPDQPWLHRRLTDGRDSRHQLFYSAPYLEACFSARTRV